MLISLFVLANPTVALAVTAPNFPSCLSPQGNEIVEYLSGSHGVPGRINDYQGSDRVYDMSPDTKLQCLCQEDGNGVQTNWWKVSSLTEDQIDVLKKDGWLLITDGSVWGLDTAPYLTKNSDYNCRAQGGQILESASSTSASNDSQGTVLAATGDKLPIWYLVTVGIVAIVGGWYLTKFNQSEDQKS